MNYTKRVSEKLPNGTYYHESTADAVVKALEDCRNSKYDFRFKITYGYPETGEAWGDVETGYIGRSTGSIKVPLIIHSNRSLGGPALLDHCILKIEYANKRQGGIIYKNEKV